MQDAGEKTDSESAARRAVKIVEVLSNRDEPMGETDSPKARDSWGSHSAGWRS